jgi:hypothetical protein
MEITKAEKEYLDILNASAYEKIDMIRKSSDEAQDMMFRMASNDTSVFAKIFFAHAGQNGMPFVPKHHMAAYKMYDDESKKYLCSIWHRGGGKTTTKRIKIMQTVCFQKKPVIGLISETEPQVWKCMRFLKGEAVSNPVIKYVFGNLKGKTPWGDKELMFSNGIYLVSRAAETAVRGINIDGQRLSEAYLDDFESIRNAATVEQRQRLSDWIDAEVKPAGERGELRLIFLGTIVHPDAFLAKADPSLKDENGNITEFAKHSIFQGRSGQFTRFDVSKEIYLGEGEPEPIWPEQFSSQLIKDEYEYYKNRNNLSLYLQEYYNISEHQSNPTINVDMIHELDAELKIVNKTAYLKYKDGRKELIRIAIGVDPARNAGMNACDSVIFIAGMLNDESWVILEVIAAKIPIEDQPKRVFEAMLKYMPYVTNIETVGYQLSLEVQVRKLTKDNKKNLLIIGNDKRESKAASYQEIDGLCHIVNTGKVRYIKDCAGIQTFKSQARAYSSGVKRTLIDTLDGFYHCIQNMYPPPKKDVDELLKMETDKKRRMRPKGFMSY